MWDVRELGALEPMDAGGVDCGLLKFLKCRFLGILPAEWCALVDAVAEAGFESVLQSPQGQLSRAAGG